MSHQLNSLFAGNFLIHPGYASSFIPTIYKALTVEAIPDMNERLQKIQNNSATKMEAAEGSEYAKAVVIISIKQPILKFTDEYMGFLGSKYYIRLMESYASDPNIAGVVLDIDSGGGQVYGTGEFYDYIKAYPKPVVTYTDGYLCSAAYYIGNAAKYIIANKRADAIGSIGAYASFVDFNGIMEKFGAKIHTMYATKSTRKNFERREIEENENYTPYIENVLDPIVETFHADMKDTRTTLNEEVFFGDTWTGAEALAMGLVDELGTLDTAVLKVYELDNQQSNNQNLDNMSNTHAKVQAVLGLTAPLALTDNGSYLNAEQLGTLETALAAADTKAEGLQTQLDAANAATTTAQTALAKANTDNTAAVAATDTQVDALVTAAGITATGTTADKLTALGSHYAAINKADGAKHTAIKTDNNPSAETPKYVDATASHNQLADRIFSK